MKGLAKAERTQHDAKLRVVDFDRAPFTIAWEVTRACAYACLHCRADAKPKRDPNELTTAEGIALIDDLGRFGTNPILVLTGGDPLMRRDLFDLAAYANATGLRVSLTPTATALTTVGRMRRARAAGVRRVAFSLDAPSADVHDRFRGFSGSFERTMEGIANATSAGLPIQINTTVTGINAHTLEPMVELLEKVGVVQWSVFFLVNTGRGALLPMVSPEEHERILNWLFDLSRTAPFDVKATAAPHYRRIAIQRTKAVGESEIVGAGFQFSDGLNRPTKGVNDGCGFMFVSHTGDVCPSGFLPLAAGNVREESAVDIYRDSDLFRSLRDPDLLKGKCGICDFRSVCGGSRARAWATTGDCLAADESCVYQPHEPHGQAA